jgi:hypothetical protein
MEDMNKRKNMIIDKKFQLKMTFSVIAIIFLVVTIIITILGINAVSNNRKVDKTIKKLEEVIISHEQHLEALQNYIDIKTVQDMKLATKILTKNMNENLSIMNRHIAIMNNIIKGNYILFTVIILFFVLQTVILYFIILKKTHTISGPVFLLKKNINAMLNGKSPELRPLRKHDEFKELYDLLVKLADDLKAKKYIE